MAGADWETGNPRRGSRRLVGAALIAVIALLFVALLRGGLDRPDPEQGLTINDRDQEVSEEAPGTVGLAGREPLQYANSGWWFCPGSAPIAAHIDRRFYPPTYPQPPPDGRRPVACFADASAAAAAGYSLAPAPAGTQIAGGVYLVPTELFLLRCQAAADALGHAVPCPRRLPYSPRTAQCPGVGPQGCVVRRASDESFFVEARGFPLPQGRCPCEASVVVAAARTGRLPQVAGDPGALRSRRRWRSGGVTSTVSVAGASDAARALLRAVVEGIEMVAPSEQAEGL